MARSKTALVLYVCALHCLTALAEETPPKIQQVPTSELFVWGVAFSPDSKYLAVAGGRRDTPGKVTLWDIQARKPKWVHLEKVGVPNLAYSPDGKTIAAGGYDFIGRLIEATTGEVRVTYEGHTAGINSVSFSPDGKRLATAGLDKLVKVWATASGRELMSLVGHANMALAVAFAPDGQHLASAGRDEKILLWDLETQKVVRTFNGHQAWIQQIVFSTDGRTLASASYDRTARVWDVDTGQCWCKLSGTQHWIQGVAFVPDSMEVATAAGDKSVRLFEVILPHQRASDPTTTARAIERLDSDSYADRAAATGELAKIGLSIRNQLAEGASPSNPRERRIRCQRLLDLLDSPPPNREFVAHDAPVQCLAFSPDGNLLATGASDGTIKLFDALSFKELATLVEAP